MKPTVERIARRLKEVKPYIHEECRAFEGDDKPGMVVTIGTNDDESEWAYQSGDNSYFGACYHFPHWSVIYLFRDSNCRGLARDAMGELKELIAV